VVDAGDGNLASITVGENEAAVEESTNLARDWVGESAAELIEGAPEVTAGEVRVSTQT